METPEVSHPGMGTDPSGIRSPTLRGHRFRALGLVKHLLDHSAPDGPDRHIARYIAYRGHVSQGFLDRGGAFWQDDVGTGAVRTTIVATTWYVFLRIRAAVKSAPGGDGVTAAR